MTNYTLAARAREVCDDPEIRRALAERDITEVYRRLVAAGLNQRQIGQLTGQRPSEVSEIVNGRAVQAVVVLERIADGLGVPRGWMGLAYTDGTYTEVQPSPPDAQEVSEDVKRRNFINAVAGAVVWGHPVIRELLTAPNMRAVPPLPRSLGSNDVAAVRDLTRQMRGLARQYGGQAETISTVAYRYMRLLSVPAADSVQWSMQAVLVDLHVCAGWACVDTRLTDQARRHFGTAMDLAAAGGYPVGLVYSLWLSGASIHENGYPNDALKLYQLGQIKLAEPGSRRDPRVSRLSFWLHAESAYTLVHLDRPDLARTELTTARGEWEPTNFNDRADLDQITALVERDLLRLDVAEQFAVSSVQHWGRSANPDRRHYALARITLAELHLAAREPDSAYLAKQAIDATAELQSARARARLAPLATALAGARDSTAQDLAVRARAVSSSQVAV